MPKITFELQVYKNGYILDKKNEHGEVLQGKIYFDKDNLLKELRELIIKLEGGNQDET